jgi:hypothetical protein
MDALIIPSPAGASQAHERLAARPILGKFVVKIRSDRTADRSARIEQLIASHR